jgi:hypothetical protein
VEFSNNLNSKLKKCFGHGFGAYPCAKICVFLKEKGPLTLG